MEPEDTKPTQPDSPEPATPITAPTDPSPAAPITPVPEKAKKGYGKRPVWQWVVIYLVAAVIVYGLIYFIFIHKSGTTGGYGY